MLVPSTVVQVLALVALVIPGLVFAAVRRLLVGPVPEDKEIGVRLARAIAVSAALDLLYLIAFGPTLIRRYVLAPSGQVEVDLARLAEGIRGVALWALALLVVVPAVLALSTHLRIRWPKNRRRERSPLYMAPTYHPAPNAWDKAAPNMAGCWVRIFTSDGYWVGGWISDGGESFVSKYPEPRDIYIEHEWRLSKTGEFIGPIDGSRGVYVPLSGTERVSWVDAPQP
jgi:hypothetical protein